jgi:hypothetical protein
VQIGKQPLNKMLMKTLFLIGYSCFFMYAFWGCNNATKKEDVKDNFYTKTNASWDAVRIPLIKPYELLKLNGSKEWDMNLQEIPGSVSNVKEVNVLQDIIVIHSGETYCNNAKVNEAWFAIMPEKHTEKGFEKKEDFDKYVSSLQIANPKFYDADNVYHVFSINKAIDWQAGLK